MKVLVVDDQMWILSGMKSRIRWEKIGVEEVYTASSAEEARKILGEKTIDILITDIEMPGESGLDLLRWMKEEEMETESILLTSHAEFDYAREGLVLGCCEYILQPARYEAIEEAVLRVEAKVEEHRKLDRMKLLSPYQGQLFSDTSDMLLGQILQGCPDPEQKLEAMAGLGDCLSVSDRHVILIVHRIIRTRETLEEERVRRTSFDALKKLLHSENAEVMQGKISENLYALFLLYDQSEEWERDRDSCRVMNILNDYLDFEQQFLEFDSAFYYVGKIGHAEEIASAVEKAQKKLQKNVMGERKVFSGNGMEGKKLLTCEARTIPVKEWEEMFRKGKGKQVPEQIRSLVREDTCSSMEESAELLKKIHQGLMAAAFQVMAEEGLDYDRFFGKNENMLKMMASYDSYDHLMETAEYIASQFTSAGREEETKDADRQVEKAIIYIRNNLDKRITRADVAEHVHMNEDYLTRLFKAKTGLGLKEYMNNEKIELAKELLLSTSISVSLIAIRTGFNNFSHFSQNFKKAEGVTPTEFREQNQK